MMETPAIASSAYGASTSVWDLGAVNNGNNNAGVALRAIPQQQFFIQHPTPEKPMAKIEVAPRRLVQVFIADPDDNIPLDQSLLYKGDQKLTDATDQELFFEIDIKSILDAHNDKRTKIINKKVKERTEHLEPVKIRDLKMVVVNVATF